MKKFWSVILALSLCLSFVSCVVDDEPIKEQTEVKTETANNDEKFGLNETAAFKNLKFTATEFKESYGKKFFEPNDGNVFVGIKFIVENISDEDQTVSTLLLFNGYADDVKLEYSFSAACAFDEGTLDGTIAPGKKLIGWCAYEVPKNWSTIELQVQSTWLLSNSAKFVFAK